MSADRQTVFDDILDLALARDEARRSTLVRVLVDGFVRDEAPRGVRETRQFEELMLNLLPQVDAFTRAVVAQKLARRADIPRAILAKLAEDDVTVAEPILQHSPALDWSVIDTAIARGGEVAWRALARRPDLSPAHRGALLATGDPETRALLKERGSVSEPADVKQAPPTAENAPPPPSFLEIEPALRRKLLQRLSEGDAPVKPLAAAAPESVKSLVRLAVLRQRDTFVETLGRLLDLPPAFMRRVMDDPEGEPILVAIRALQLPEDVFAQILALAHPAVGGSIDKALDLRALYRATSPAAAATILATWRVEAGAAARHRPVQTSAARAATRDAPALRPSVPGIGAKREGSR